MGIPPPPGMGNRGGSQIYRKNKKGEQMINEEQKRDMEQYLSTNELMEMLGISRSTVYRLMDRGMPFIKVGAINRFPKDQVVAWFGGE